MVRVVLRSGLWTHAALLLAAIGSLSALAPAQSLNPPPFSLFGTKQKAAPPQAQPFHATQSPAFSIPAEPFGFSAPNANYLGFRNSLISLDFIDEDRLLFTFRVPGLLRRDVKADESESQRQIRALVLHLPQGNVEAETVWTLHDRDRYLYMLDKGRFLLRDRNELKIGDASLQLKPYLRFPGPVLWVDMDTSRQFLVTGSLEPAAEKAKSSDTPGSSAASGQAADAGGSEREEIQDMVLRILRRDNGHVMFVSHVHSAVHVPMNTEGYLEVLRSKGDGWMLNFNRFDGGSRVVGTVDSVCSPVLNFVSSREILINTCGTEGESRLVAMSTDGRRLWWDAPKAGPAVWPLMVMGSNGTRMALETLQATHAMSGANPLGTEDIKGQVVQVYDAASGKIALKAEASPIYDAGGNVAISPSGRRIAVLMIGAIQIFDLPPAEPLSEAPLTQAGR